MLQAGSENLHFNKLPKEFFLLILTFESLCHASVFWLQYIFYLQLGLQRFRTFSEDAVRIVASKYNESMSVNLTVTGVKGGGKGYSWESEVCK